MKTLGERFWSKVAVRGFEECWEWTAHKVQNGYGNFVVSGNTKQVAHRVAYELVVGEIPDGLVLDHLCRNRGCVNPNHLEPVTMAENVRRGLRGALTTHCPKGHPYSGDNLQFVRNNHGNLSRLCRACNRQRCRDYYQSKKELVSAYGEID